MSEQKQFDELMQLVQVWLDCAQHATRSAAYVAQNQDDYSRTSGDATIPEDRRKFEMPQWWSPTKSGMVIEFYDGRISNIDTVWGGEYRPLRIVGPSTDIRQYATDLFVKRVTLHELPSTSDVLSYYAVVAIDGIPVTPHEPIQQTERGHWYDADAEHHDESTKRFCAMLDAWWTHNLFATTKTYVWYGENGYDKPQTGREQTLELAVAQARSYMSRLSITNFSDRSAYASDPKYRMEVAGTHYHPFAGNQRFMVQVIEEA